MAQPLALAVGELHTLIGNAASCEDHRQSAAPARLFILRTAMMSRTGTPLEKRKSSVARRQVRFISEVDFS